MRNFRFTLMNKYVKKNKTPFNDYDGLEPKHWDLFAAKALTEDFKEKSRKAKISAQKNYEPARVGRRGMIGFMDVWEDRWNQLVSENDLLSHMQDERLKIYTTSRAQLNPVTNLYQLGPHQSSEGVLTGRLKELHEKEREMKANGSYYEARKDVVTEVVGNGREHGGRSRLVSRVIGTKKQFVFHKKGRKLKRQKYYRRR
ncbi:hypothetical protein L1987_18202 [Smallanthus sonchifolius]|uniref:Uncharacterized protein n=1 Tax=Smallanthus sonchifolius TaxID=185202 RepID=A0ACB9J2J1_9ASTR|nr:hypothetical protein L1987_18202 [Smallanthus sonchifolius]